jgi:hypothetical protein
MTLTKAHIVERLFAQNLFTKGESAQNNRDELSGFVVPRCCPYLEALCSTESSTKPVVMCLSLGLDACGFL